MSQHDAVDIKFCWIIRIELTIALKISVRKPLFKPRDRGLVDDLRSMDLCVVLSFVVVKTFRIFDKLQKVDGVLRSIFCRSKREDGFAAWDFGIPI